MGVILVVLNLFFAALAFEERRYESQGVIVHGTAIGLNSKGKWAYKFTVDGRALEGDSEVLVGTASKLKQGGPVEVQYLSGAPGTNRIPGQCASYATWRNMAPLAFVAGITLLFEGTTTAPALVASKSVNKKKTVFPFSLEKSSLPCGTRLQRRGVRHRAQASALARA